MASKKSVLSREDREYMRAETDPSIRAAYEHLVIGEAAFEGLRRAPVPADTYETRDERYRWAQRLDILAGVTRNHMKVLRGALWTNDAARSRADDLAGFLGLLAEDVEVYRAAH